MPDFGVHTGVLGHGDGFTEHCQLVIRFGPVGLIGHGKV